jgi:hypothetical protein
MKSNKIQVYAIIRWDKDLKNPIDAFTVKEIVEDNQLADSEVERLNRINADKNVMYFCQITRFLYKEYSGRVAGTERKV